jgi:hypothetical protein
MLYPKRKGRGGKNRRKEKETSHSLQLGQKLSIHMMAKSKDLYPKKKKKNQGLKTGLEN